MSLPSADLISLNWWGRANMPFESTSLDVARFCLPNAILFATSPIPRSAKVKLASREPTRPSGQIAMPQPCAACATGNLPNPASFSCVHRTALTAFRGVCGAGKLVFPSERHRTKPMSNNTILKGLKRIGYGGRMTGHGFRGLASTLLHEQGYPHEHVELQLAQVDGVVVGPVKFPHSGFKITLHI
jgi:hypothetical protein